MPQFLDDATSPFVTDEELAEELADFSGGLSAADDVTITGAWTFPYLNIVGTGDVGAYIGEWATDDTALQLGPADDYAALQYQTGGSVLQLEGAATMDLNIFSGKLTFATDTNLYRSAANTLKTDDSFIVAADSGRDSLSISATGTDVGLTIGGDVEIYRSAASTVKIGSYFQYASASGVLYVSPAANEQIALNGGTGGIQFGFATSATLGGAAAANVITVTDSFQFPERSDPSAPGTDKGILYCKDNGSGKTQLVIKFNTGAVQVIATQP